MQGYDFGGGAYIENRAYSASAPTRDGGDFYSSYAYSNRGGYRSQNRGRRHNPHPMGDYDSGYQEPPYGGRFGTNGIPVGRGRNRGPYGRGPVHPRGRTLARTRSRSAQHNSRGYSDRAPLYAPKEMQTSETDP